MQRWLRQRIDSYADVRPRFVSSLVMVAAAGTSALVAIGYAKAVDFATEFMRKSSVDHQWSFIAAAPFWFMLSWLLIRYFAPEAGGSGIPQVLASIERAATHQPEKRGAWRSIRLISVKIASSLSAILGGGTIGREGPTIQISAAVFELFDGLFKRYITSHRSREALLITGGAAGLAAAFNTPLGGVVFAIEELASQHFKSFKGMLILAVVTAGYVTQAILGPYLFIGHPSIGFVTARDTLSGLVASLFIGILGALFGVILFPLMRVVKNFSVSKRLLLAAVTGLMMAFMCVLLGPDASGGGSLLIRKLLFGSLKEVSEVGWVLALWRVLGLTMTYLSGCAGGIFAPSLAAGAAIGAVVANFFFFDNHNLIIVLGMIAFLTGATRSPFTCFILVFEMTDRQAAVIPMMAAALIANIAAKFVDKDSFYEKSRDELLAGGFRKVE